MKKSKQPRRWWGLLTSDDLLILMSAKRKDVMSYKGPGERVIQVEEVQRKQKRKK